jgi:DNA polymerase III epsilon subunit family exonuclease
METVDTLAGKRFCITGGLHVDREEMIRLLEARGAQVTTQVSGKTDALIVGSDPGYVKLNGAMEWNTKTLDEEEVWGLLGLTAPDPAIPFELPSYQPLLFDDPAGMPSIDEAVYSVVDVETAQSGRVVEIAIVQVSGDGTLLDEYATLVNPGGPMGFTHVHGITGPMVKDAPTFREIAGDVADRLAGNIFVAHNAGFDRGVVSKEFLGLGHKLPELESICTLRLARSLRLHPPKRANLGACCAYMGIENEHAHAALADTRATAELLLAYLRAAQQSGMTTLPHLGVHRPPAPRDQWPQLKGLGRVHLRRGVELRSC